MAHTVTIAATTVVLGGTQYTFSSATLNIYEGVNYIYADAAGLHSTTSDVQRTATLQPLWQLTVLNGLVQGSLDLRSWGGVDFSLAHPNKTFANIGGQVALGSQVTGALPFGNNSSAITSVINSSSQILASSFTGALFNLDGSLSGFTSGLYANTALQAGVGNIVSAEAIIARASSGDGVELALLDSTGQNGYILYHYGGANQYLYLFRISGGTQTALASANTYATADTNKHDYRITVTITSSGHASVEYSVDGTYSFIQVDSSAPTYGSSLATPYIITTGKVWNYDATSGSLAYSNQHPFVRGILSNSGQLNVSPTPGVTGSLPYANHASAIRSVINSSGQMPVSSPLNPQASILPTACNSYFGYRFITGDTHIYYYLSTSSTPGGVPTIWYPDGSTLTTATVAPSAVLSPTTSTSGWSSYNMGATGLSVYCLISWNVNTSAWVFLFSSSPITPAQFEAALADGFVALVLSVSGTQLSGTTGTAGGGGHSGGGHLQ